MNESQFKEKYKNSEWALKRLEEAKDFWKIFPKTNFYDKDAINTLKEKFKDNAYILERIDKELSSWLDPQFKHYLEAPEIIKYINKASDLVDNSMSYYGNYMFRPIVVIKISDELSVPFYLSSWLWEKKWVPTDKFYPFFWIWSDWRLNKWVESEINNYYGSPLLAAIAKELDKKYKEKTLDPKNWGPNDSQSEVKMLMEEVNLWKSPVNYWKWWHNNINEVLKKVSKIKESD